MMNISRSNEGNDAGWKKEVRDFLKAEKEDEKQEVPETICYGGECAYCGWVKSADLMKWRRGRGWICDECLKKTIMKRVDATYLADQSLKLLSLMYGIYFVKRFKVRFKGEWPRPHQYPWHVYDVTFKQKKSRKDRLYIVRNLPEGTAEAAIVSALLDYYLSVRGAGDSLPDFSAGDRGDDLSDPSAGDMRDAEKGKEDKAVEAGRGSADDKWRSGIVIWCTLHYLYIVRGEAYARHYKEKLSDVEKKRYEVCEERLSCCMKNEYIKMERILSLC